MEKSKRVMIVDDEPDFLEAFRMTFEAKSFRVTATSSLDEAREKIGRVDPDVIVLGTLAPPGQAFTFHQWLNQRPRYKQIPLLVIDARDEDRDTKGWRRFEGYQLESDDYVSKPIEPASLVPRILSLLQKATRKIKVLVADDHTMVRDGICAVLSLQRDMDVVGEAVSGKEAIDKVLRLMPNVVLMDIVMPEMSGLDAAKRISEKCPQSRVLVLTQYDDEENLVMAKSAGAYGFIPKRAASSELVAGVRSVAGGHNFFHELAAS